MTYLIFSPEIFYESFHVPYLPHQRSIPRACPSIECSSLRSSRFENHWSISFGAQDMICFRDVLIYCGFASIVSSSKPLIWKFAISYPFSESCFCLVSDKIRQSRCLQWCDHRSTNRNHDGLQPNGLVMNELSTEELEDTYLILRGKVKEGLKGLDGRRVWEDGTLLRHRGSYLEATMDSCKMNTPGSLRSSKCQTPPWPRYQQEALIWSRISF